MKRKHSRLRIFLVCAGVVGISAAAFACMLYFGVLSLNHPSVKQYPIRGVDVSAYQGEIDWKVLSCQGIDFAFIKATEGSGFQDEHFQYNWENAGNYGLKIGAYHFFSFDSSGDTQADNFIRTVTKKEGALPPAVDVEFYGDKAKNPPDKEGVDQQLTILLNRLEAYYGRKPILYCTHKSFDLYLKDSYDDHPLWIRDVFLSPRLPNKRRWTFWQYSSHECLKGYNGKEKHIDMNVFYGSQDEWDSFL